MRRRTASEPASFPKLGLPVQPPFAPMEARREEELPEDGKRWQFEPKWDGFRAIVFRDGDQVVIQSKSGQTLARYFPELVAELLRIHKRQFVLDGEIVLRKKGKISFGDLQLRLHPAQSRIQRLSRETPATFMAFDLLYLPGLKSGRELVTQPLWARRAQLEKFFASVPQDSAIELTPITRDRAQAQRWFKQLSKMGLDGVMCKDANEPYHSGDREAMIKVKHLKTADCVVVGFRYQEGRRAVAALTLGVYGDDGLLHHVGSTSSFNAKQRRELLKILEPLRGGPGFTWRAPGLSRWSKRENEWVAVLPELVCEVRYDYFNDGRFRHGTRFLRWRPDKAPKACRFDQFEAA